MNTTQPEFVGSLLREKKPRREVLYFTRGAVGERDLYVTRRNAHGSFEVAVPIEELNGLFDDARPTVRRDGLEMFFDSNRPGTEGALDIWVTTRARTSHPWSDPVNVTSLNSASFRRPSFVVLRRHDDLLPLRSARRFGQQRHPRLDKDTARRR